MAISGLGRSVEDRFREITGAERTASPGEGDAVVDGTCVEIKKASADTLNQVRAVKYIPLVCYADKTATWYVVPAHQVVRLVAGKKRGQHTENPFESATISVKKLSAFVVDEADLLQKVRDAIASTKSFPKLAAAMQDVLARSRKLAQESASDVAAVLREYKLM